MTSKNTSINTLNRIYKMLDKGDGLILFDYGCGKYDTNKEYAESKGYEWYGYDPYNRSDEENFKSLRKIYKDGADVIICSNVLNVVDDYEGILAELKKCAYTNAHIYITIYEGNKSGIGKQSKKDCWQRNEKCSAYLPTLNKYFSLVEKVNGTSNIFHCMV